jgi:hypothetical protein
MDPRNPTKKNHLDIYKHSQFVANQPTYLKFLKIKKTLTTWGYKIIIWLKKSR